MEFPEITNFLLHGNWILVIKAPILLLIFLYSIFIFIVISRIKALNRTLQIKASQASKTLQTLSVVHLALTISLFIITLVIV
jgi:hypothetical protein